MHAAYIVYLTMAIALQAVNSAPVADDQYSGSDLDWLCYDNGSPAWLTWGGTYRGVWFNTGDFFPGSPPYQVGTAELWFYHHSEFSWDISQVTVEIWNGDAAGPTEFLGSVYAIALHYSPVYIVFNPMLVTEPDFWCLINTEASTGGWPSTLGDGMQGYVYHSFFSDDFISWEPWEQGGACNYFMRVTDTIIGTGLSRISWGGMKVLF